MTNGKSSIKLHPMEALKKTEAAQSDVSEHQASFDEKLSKVHRVYHRVAYIPNGHAFEGNTINRNDYIEHDSKLLQSPKRHQPPTYSFGQSNIISGSDNGFIDMTTGSSISQSDFTSKNLPRQVKRQEEQYFKNTDKMDFRTTQSVSYQPHEQSQQIRKTKGRNPGLQQISKCSILNIGERSGER